MTTSENLQKPVPIFESILEVAAEKPISKFSKVDGAGILQTELAKPGGNSLGEINLKINPIQSPQPPAVVLEKTAYPDTSSLVTNNAYSTVNNVSNVNSSLSNATSTVNNAVSNILSKLIEIGRAHV